MKYIKNIGWFFLLIGILGYIPGITVAGKLLWLFRVDAFISMIYVFTGVCALLVSKKTVTVPLFFKIFGVIYFIFSVFGFIGGDNVLGMFAVNLASNILHSVSALTLLYFGFIKKN